MSIRSFSVLRAPLFNPKAFELTRAIQKVRPYHAHFAGRYFASDVGNTGWLSQKEKGEEEWAINRHDQELLQKLREQMKEAEKVSPKNPSSEKSTFVDPLPTEKVEQQALQREKPAAKPSQASRPDLSSYKDMEKYFTETETRARKFNDEIKSDLKHLEQQLKKYREKHSKKTS